MDVCTLKMTTNRDLARDAATESYHIDALCDRLLALRRLADWHQHRTGEAIHRSVRYRWAKRGIRGIRLPTILVGGVRFTSEEAVRWWTRTLAAVEPRQG